MFVKFRPDSRLLMAGVNDGTTSVWRIDTQKIQAELVSVYSTALPLDASFSPDGRLVAIGCEKAALLYETSSGQLFGQPIEHQGNVFSLTFDPNGRLITASDPTVRFWDVPSLKTARQTTGLGDVIYSVAYGPAGPLVASGTTDGSTVWTLNPTTGEKLGRPIDHENGLNRNYDSILFSPDGRYVAAKITGVDRAEVRVYEVATGAPVGPSLVHKLSIVDVAFSPDGATLLTGSNQDGDVRLWETVGGRQLWEDVRPGNAGRVLYHPDGRTVFIEDIHGTIRALDA